MLAWARTRFSISLRIVPIQSILVNNVNRFWRDSASNTDMGKALGDDLRHKLLFAYDQGEGTLEELASRFVVSVGWAKKISAMRTAPVKPSAFLTSQGVNRTQELKRNNR